MKNKSCSFVNGWVLMALMAGGLILYFIPLQSTSFCFDDHTAIENDEAIRTIDIPAIFHTFNTRFLVGLSFAINYKWCGLFAPGYRIVNLLIHCFNAFLVFLLVQATLGLERKSRHPERSEGSLQWPALFAGFLFLVHPMATEPVNFITQRFVLMGSFFYLLTLLLYIYYRTHKQPGYLLATLAAATFAMFCKEFVVTLPLMLGIYDFYFFNTGTVTWKERCKRLFPFFMIVLIVPLLLLKTPSDSIGVAHIAKSGGAGFSDITRAGHSFGRKAYFLTELRVICTYVRLMFLPIHQNFDYDYPISKALDGPTLLAAAFLLGLLTIAWLAYSSHRLVSWGIVWFFIALSVESSLIPIGHVIAEYRAYLASVGFVFVLTALIYRQERKIEQLNIIAALILAALALLAYHRNTIWKNELTLWNDTVHKSPHKARPYIGRGSAYIALGDYKQAMLDFKTAVAIDPKTKYALSNLAASYLQEGHLKEALAYYDRAIANDPTELKAYFGRATTYYYLKEFDKARGDVQKIKALGTALDYKRICRILKTQPSIK